MSTQTDAFATAATLASSNQTILQRQRRNVPFSPQYRCGDNTQMAKLMKGPVYIEINMPSAQI